VLKLCQNTLERERDCLRCERKFLSSGPHNRLCRACLEALDASSTPEEVYPLVFLRESSKSD
jgi:hypothetical protein